MTTPGGSLDICGAFRNTVTSLLGYMQQFSGASTSHEAMLDVDKCRELSEKFAHKIRIPSRFRMILYKASALELLQFQRIPEFCASLRSSGGGTLGLAVVEMQGSLDMSDASL